MNFYWYSCHLCFQSLRTWKETNYLMSSRFISGFAKTTHYFIIFFIEFVILKLFIESDFKEKKGRCWSLHLGCECSQWHNLKRDCSNKSQPRQFLVASRSSSRASLLWSLLPHSLVSLCSSWNKRILLRSRSRWCSTLKASLRATSSLFNEKDECQFIFNEEEMDTDIHALLPSRTNKRTLFFSFF